MPNKSGTRYEMSDGTFISFVVYINKKEKFVSVYKPIYDHVNNLFLDEEFLYESKYQTLFGTGAYTDTHYSVLFIHIGGTEYLQVGENVYLFHTVHEDIIVRYEAPFGNFRFYPAAIGTKYVYLLLDNEYIPIEHFDLNKDLYGQYYGIITTKEKKINIDKDKQKFNLTIIHEKRTDHN